MKPVMRVVQLKQQHHILTGSNRAVKGVSKNNDEGIIWNNGGFEDGEGDM